jgi:anti-sigma factor RsiW
MTVSRDVVYDLLPGYFAGDLSADSRALVDNALAADAEFAAMARRFERLRRHPQASASDATSQEANALSRARRAAQRRGEFRGLGVAYAIATVAVLAAGAFGFRTDRALIIAAAFGVTATLCGAGWYLAGRRPEWFGESRFW